MSAECNWCDSRYHLNQRNDIEAKDCGEVWIDEQYLALQFACQTCLAGQPQASGGGPTAPRARPAGDRAVASARVATRGAREIRTRSTRAADGRSGEEEAPARRASPVAPAATNDSRAQRAASGPRSPEWRWRTFPVFCAFVVGLLVASFINGRPSNNVALRRADRGAARLRLLPRPPVRHERHHRRPHQAPPRGGRARRDAGRRFRGRAGLPATTTRRASATRCRAPSHATPSRAHGHSPRGSGRYPSRIQKYTSMPCTAGAGAYTRARLRRATSPRPAPPPPCPRPAAPCSRRRRHDLDDRASGCGARKRYTTTPRVAPSRSTMHARTRVRVAIQLRRAPKLGVDLVVADGRRDGPATCRATRSSSRSIARSATFTPALPRRAARATPTLRRRGRAAAARAGRTAAASAGTTRRSACCAAGGRARP